MNSNTPYKQQLSAAITWLRFPLIFFIILLHCYSTVRLNGEHNTFFKAIYPFGLWIGETGVPGFFFISGFLFFYSKKSYREKMISRFHTLLIPYLLWNALLLFLYLIAFAAGYPQDINHRNIGDFEMMDYLRLFWDRGSYDNGNFVPLLCPFWYIRNLLIISIFTPLLYYLIKFGRELFLVIITTWWLTTYDNAFIPQTILFFSLGAYFSILNINPLRLFKSNQRFTISIFLIFAIADNMTHIFWGTTFNLQIHRLALITNIPALLLIADYCISKELSSKLLPKAAFIVFAVHYPIVVALRKLCVSQFASSSDGIHIILYWICVIIVTFICIAIYKAMNKYIPKTKNILSGNR